MISTQYINLNMVPSGVMPVLHCSQYDVGRPLGVVIYNGSESVDLSGYTVTIEGTRTDRTPVTAGVITDGNIGVFTTTPTMTNENDTYRAKVVLTDNAGRVSSLAFVMCVDEKTMDENAEEIEEDASLYQQYTGTVQTIIAQIRGDLAAEITARQNAISAEASARQAADNTLQSNINAETSTRATQDASLQSQINQLIAPSGSAPSAAEVENARIGSDGTVYPTLGDAIRTQNSLLKSHLGETTYNLVAGTISGNTISSDGSILANAGYSMSYAPVESGKTYTIRTDESMLVCGYFTSLPAVGSISYDRTKITTYNFTITAPINGYFAFRTTNGYTTPQINEGTTLLDYIPHLIGKDIIARAEIEALHSTVVARTESIENRLASYAPFAKFDYEAHGIALQNGYRDDSGNFVANNAYRTYDMPIYNDCQCYFDSTSSYYSICVYSGTPVGASTFLPPRLRFNNSDEDTAPKVGSKLNLSAGQYISVTFGTGSDYGFYLDDWHYYAKLKPNVYMGEAQLDQIRNAVSDGAKNYATFHGSGDGEGVYLYYPTSYGKLRYNFAHASRPNINADTWRIDSLYAVSDDLTERFAATTSGEWECAIRLANRPDFSGGLMHGDEITTTLVFIFDGVPYTAQEVSAKGSFYFDELKIVELSNLYDSLDNTTLIATHQKEYTFNDDGITINQNLTWTVTDELSACYLAMLPASKAYTDMFYTDVDYTPVVAENNYGDHADVKKITLYSDDHGFICSLEIKKYPTGYQGGDIMNIRDNNSDYNKVYFNVCEHGQITSGTKWVSESVYTFCVGEPAE